MREPFGFASCPDRPCSPPRAPAWHALYSRSRSDLSVEVAELAAESDAIFSSALARMSRVMAAVPGVAELWLGTTR
ncbi:hypothetical protein MKX07_001852 [Trichoderma sp. CBMAI-0711]|nr:hypothetical protein MKX07_001852 [Trichoderma sp. CBMAI-0711]